jgi:hypothetical protein
MTVLLAADLDRTLIYSVGALGAGDLAELPLVCVETRQRRPVSFMTWCAASLLSALASHTVLVPFTTRTPEQLARVRLPGAPAPFAVAANGGLLLVDGAADPSWSAQIARGLAQSAPLAVMWTELERTCDPRWTSALRQAADMFCYAVVDRTLIPAEVLGELAARATKHGWQISLQGRKLYCVPVTLTKAAAMREVARRCDATSVLAAGDSLLDIDLLAASDGGIHPGHGEIAESGWSARHVSCTGSRGAQAGEDICRWFLDQTTTH